MGGRGFVQGIEGAGLRHGSIAPGTRSESDTRNARRMWLAWTRLACAHSVYTPFRVALRASWQVMSYGLHAGRSDTPMCCEPNVMRLFTGGELNLSTYARKNWPPMNAVLCYRSSAMCIQAKRLTLREAHGVESVLQLSNIIQLLSYKFHLLIYIAELYAHQCL